MRSWVELAETYLWLVVIPAVVNDAADERERWDPSKAWLAIPSYLTATAPILREAGQAIQALFGEHAFDYRGGPTGELLAQTTRFAKAAHRGDPEKMFLEALRTSGYAFALPTNQATITMTGLLEMMRGGDDNPLHLLMRKKE